MGDLLCKHPYGNTEPIVNKRPGNVLYGHKPLWLGVCSRQSSQGVTSCMDGYCCHWSTFERDNWIQLNIVLSYINKFFIVIVEKVFGVLYFLRGLAIRSISGTKDIVP